MEGEEGVKERERKRREKGREVEERVSAGGCHTYTYICMYIFACM